MFSDFVSSPHSYFTPYEFSNMGSEMAGDAVHLFGTIGMALTYSTHSLDRGSVGLIFQDPRNTLFDFYEEGGQDMLWELTDLVEGSDSEASLRELHVPEVIAFLETEELPPLVRETRSFKKAFHDSAWP